MYNFRKLPRTVFLSSLIFSIVGFLFSVLYSLVSLIYICPTNINCPGNPIPVLLLIGVVTLIFFIFGVLFGVIILKLYNFFRVE
ncbi:MAG: hypothetical protein CL772_00485 [Chloroflexi bacterium]|nr:hypothetical protein [Chloroflexota bacterium]